ncbi:MAG: ATP-binding cassette domain-containing protein [Oscillospiraceae bacterium]|nr:ATP-binding cassette domain-containing protein [Oscillospiraceae bacterium]
MSLQVSHLTKRFGEKTAVRDLSFRMDEPGIYGLIGTNGAGKTTTIRMMLGILRPDGGEATWDGKPISRGSLRYGYMPEERGIYMKTKILEQLVYFGQLRGMSRSAAAAAAKKYLERLGVTEYADTLAEKLSKGNQQKIQLIATLLHDPQLVILDEPFSGLDPLNTELLRGLITELAGQGKFIIMSSHQMSTVEEFCREITLLHRGDALLQGDLRKIKAGYGPTKLLLSLDEGTLDREAQDALAEQFGFLPKERLAAETVYAVPSQGAGQAGALLRVLLDRGAVPTKFELGEPSLHEIFLEKVGQEEVLEAAEVSQQKKGGGAA